MPSMHCHAPARSMLLPWAMLLDSQVQACCSSPLKHSELQHMCMSGLPCHPNFLEIAAIAKLLSVCCSHSELKMPILPELAEEAAALPTPLAAQPNPSAAQPNPPAAQPNPIAAQAGSPQPQLQDGAGFRALFGAVLYKGRSLPASMWAQPDYLKGCRRGVNRKRFLLTKQAQHHLCPMWWGGAQLKALRKVCGGRRRMPKTYFLPRRNPGGMDAVPAFLDEPVSLGYYCQILRNLLGAASPGHTDHSLRQGLTIEVAEKATPDGVLSCTLGLSGSYGALGHRERNEPAMVELRTAGIMRLMWAGYTADEQEVWAKGTEHSDDV